MNLREIKLACEREKEGEIKKKEMKLPLAHLGLLSA